MYEGIQNRTESIKTARKPARAAAKKEAAPLKTEEVFLQFGGEEWNMDALREKAVAAYLAEGHRRNSIHRLSLYVKPEERMIYYVVNGKTNGAAAF